MNYVLNLHSAIHLQPHFHAAGTGVEDIFNDSLLTDISPWSVLVPDVRFDFTNLKKYETYPEQYKQLS